MTPFGAELDCLGARLDWRSLPGCAIAARMSSAILLEAPQLRFASDTSDKRLWGKQAAWLNRAFTFARGHDRDAHTCRGCGRSAPDVVIGKNQNILPMHLVAQRVEPKVGREWTNNLSWTSNSTV